MVQRYQAITGFLLLTLLVGAILSAGCTTPAKDPVIGTFEWSDGKGYTERYTFGENHSFHAQALGSGFSGTWENVGPGKYQVTYQAENLPGENNTHTDLLLYDKSTDAIYLPAHERVP